MLEHICTGCFARSRREPSDDPRCFGCGSVTIRSKPQRWAITSRGGRLWLLDKTSGATALQLPNTLFADELMRMLNFADELLTVCQWLVERNAALLVTADMAATAWLATLDLNRVPHPDAETIGRFVAKTEYLAGMPSSESITKDVITPLANRDGWPGARTLQNLVDLDAMFDRCVEEAAALMHWREDRDSVPAHVASALDALMWVLQGDQESRPSLKLEDAANADGG